MRADTRAGMIWIVPALVMILLGVSGTSRPVEAIPNDDPLSEPSPTSASEERKPGKHESAALRVAGKVRTGSEYPPSLDALNLLLFMYATDRKAEDLERAVSMARSFAADRSPAGPMALFMVERAGGGTLNEATEALRVATSGPIDAAGEALLLQAMFVRTTDKATVRDAMVSASSYLGQRLRTKGNRTVLVTASGEEAATLARYAEGLRVALATASLSGSDTMRDQAVSLGEELIRKFWNDSANRLDSGTSEDTLAEPLRLNAQAATTLWELGYVSGNTLLKGRALRIIGAIAGEALSHPESAPAAALAVLRTSWYPVQMVLIGTAGESKLAELRRASYYFFEPRRIMIHLDPAIDRGRLEELGYPPELAPVLFVCVESVCSAPIQTPDGLLATVKQILDISSGVQQ